jgi:hypothetical protein
MRLELEDKIDIRIKRGIQILRNTTNSLLYVS